MTRVLFLITDFDRGGAEKALFELVRRLDRERFAPQVAALGHRGYYSARYRQLGVPVHHLNLPRPARAQALLFPTRAKWAVLRLARLLRRERIDVLQSFLFHANMMGRAAAALARTPVVLGGVRTAEPRHWHTMMDGLTFRLVDGEVCVSEHVREFQASRAGLPRARLFVVPQGVDPEEFPTPAAPFGRGTADSRAERLLSRTTLDLPADAPVFGFVGRLCEAKALPDLIAAFRDVLKSAPGAMLVIAGDGPLAIDLRRRVLQLGLGHNMRLPGWLDDPRVLYAAADCLVLSSVVEGMPRVVLEAMAAGLPVVSTDAPGCDELIVQGQTGLLVPRRRPGELAAAMLRIVNDPSGAMRMGEEGRRRALGQFGLDRMARRYEELYERLLRRKKKG